MSTQAKDTIVYKDKINTVHFVVINKKDGSGSLSPLYPLKDRLNVSLTPIQAHSGNYRGFTCGWDVIDDQLYLIRFSSNSFRIYTWEQFLGKAPPDEENAQKAKKLFPPDEVHYKADWFSGVIVARAYRTQNKQEHNGWDLEFDHGRLIEATPRFVVSPKRLKDYIEED